MISKTIYFMIELIDLLDGNPNQVLCKEDDLADFIANYDKDKYKITNVYGVTNLFLESREFIKQDDTLEKGEQTNA